MTNDQKKHGRASTRERKAGTRPRIVRKSEGNTSRNAEDKDDVRKTVNPRFAENKEGKGEGRGRTFKPKFSDEKPQRDFRSRPKEDSKPYEKREKREWTDEKPKRNFRSGPKEDNKPYEKREKREWTDEKPKRNFRSGPKEDSKPYEKREKRVWTGEKPKRNFRSDKTDDRKPAGKREQRSTSITKEKVYDGLTRLNKYIANSGVCSRREADELIKCGAVKVNGEIITELGTKVKSSDVVEYGDQRLNAEKPVYLLLNKPKDYITTSDDPQKRRTVLSLVAGACKERIFPVGRLDRNTTGLLLFTNDGELAKKLLHPKYNVRKVYHVELDKNITKADMEKISAGLELEDGVAEVDEIVWSSDAKNAVGLEIHIGKNRVVRRIFESLGYHVVKLDRVIFAGLTKKNLPRAKWRFLSEKEVNHLKMNNFS